MAITGSWAVQVEPGDEVEFGVIVTGVDLVALRRHGSAVFNTRPGGNNSANFPTFGERLAIELTNQLSNNLTVMGPDAAEDDDEDKIPDFTPEDLVAAAAEGNEIDGAVQRGELAAEAEVAASAHLAGASNR